MAGTEKATVPVQSGGGISEITDLVKLLTGTQTSSAQTGDTGALSSIIAELGANSPAQQQAVMQTIFQQAAGKIPGIMGNTYNATGSRAAPGQLSPQLQDLMSQVTLAAQQQMAAQSLQNSQQRIAAAQTIAGANRSAVTREATGGTKFLQDAGKLLATADVAKKLTGFDAVAKVKSGAKSLFDMATADSGAAGTSGMQLVSGDPGSFGAAGDLSGLNFGSMPGYEGVSSLMPTGIDQLVATLGGDSGSSAASLDIGGLMSSADSITSADVNAVTNWNGNTDGSTLSNSDWDAMGDDATNFSSGSDASASSGSGTNYGSYLKAAKYIDDPKSVEDIFDFSDGDWKDDIGDVTDAGSLYWAPLGFVRPALTVLEQGVGHGIDIAVANTESALDLWSDPDQWLKDLTTGNNKSVNSMLEGTEEGLQLAGDFASGIGQSVVDTGDMIGRATETVGNAVGDVFESVGDFFGF